MSFKTCHSVRVYEFLKDGILCAVLGESKQTNVVVGKKWKGAPTQSESPAFLVSV